MATPGQHRVAGVVDRPLEQQQERGRQVCGRERQSEAVQALLPTHVRAPSPLPLGPVHPGDWATGC